MGWWQVSTDTLAGSRFVISPLAETTASLLALERGTAAHPGERQWLDTHRAAYLLVRIQNEAGLLRPARHAGRRAHVTAIVPGGKGGGFLT
jgi:hypothetical protein